MQLTTNRYSAIPMILLLFSLVLTSCLDSSDSNQGPGNLLEEAEAVNDFSTFVDFVKDPGAIAVDTSTLSQGTTPLTVLIPTNDAFSELPEGMIDELTAEELGEVMSYHIVEELIDLQNINETADFTSMQGGDLYFEIVPNNQGNANLFINGGNYLGGRQASNGVIYATDQVLFPDSYLDVTGLVAKRYELNSFDEAIDDADLHSTLEDTTAAFTIFAPSEEAVGDAGLSAEDVEYHILEEKLLSSELSSQSYTTMDGQDLDVEVSG
ncbi:fasciclin domain-containing protein, partial [Fodinibius sp.]|uniref:fasciclin domain-containing protein n=1 Tax=Fodinibius sp. TaxID=1872440 RepID=UPI003563CDAB